LLFATLDNIFFMVSLLRVLSIGLEVEGCIRSKDP
jgi:hypothetical protein